MRQRCLRPGEGPSVCERGADDPERQRFFPLSQHLVHLHTPDGVHQIHCADDEFVLDAAARQGVVLPAVCRGGACSVCVARHLSGPEADQAEQTYLTEEDLAAGFVLLCVAMPRGECAFQTHQNEAFLKTLEPES